MRGIRDRAGKVERLLAFLGDDGRGNGDIVFSGADAGQNTGPWQDLLLDLERRVFAQVLDQLVVETGRLAVLDEFEGTEIVLGGHDQPALLDLIHARGPRRASPCRNDEASGKQSEQQTSRERVVGDNRRLVHDEASFADELQIRTAGRKSRMLVVALSIETETM